MRSSRAARRAAGPRPLAPGPLPPLRRGDHVLGARRDRQGRGRHPRVGRARAGARRSSTRPWPRLRRRRSERDWVAARLAPLVGAGAMGRGGAARSRSPPGAGSSRRCQRAPLVLVIEDLHWADAALLDFLEHLLDWATPSRCSWSARRARSFSSGSRRGAGASETRPTISLSPLPERGDRAALCRAARAGACSPPRRSARCSNGPAGTRSTPRSSSGCCRPRLVAERGRLAVEEVRCPRPCMLSSPPPRHAVGRAEGAPAGRRGRRQVFWAGRWPL